MKTIDMAGSVEKAWKAYLKVSHVGLMSVEAQASRESAFVSGFYAAMEVASAVAKSMRDESHQHHSKVVQDNKNIVWKIERDSDEPDDDEGDDSEIDEGL